MDLAFEYLVLPLMQTREAIPKTLHGVPVAEESWEWEQFAFALAFFVGCIQLLAGVLRLGLVVNFISEAVIMGFTAGAAFLTASTQVMPPFRIVLLIQRCMCY